MLNKRITHIALAISCAFFAGQALSASDITSSTKENANTTFVSTLDGTVKPSKNFELIDWSLSIPIDKNNDKKSDQISPRKLARGFTHSKYFYTAEDGGLVFNAPVKGPKTSINTSYTRSELREMLNRGNRKIKVKGVNKNNWVFGSSEATGDVGGRNGVLNATLKVDHVTTTGIDKEIGRVIVGQIHANHDEPIRLYYRKLANNTKGSIYFAHEPIIGKEIYIEMLGSKKNDASDPVDGIELGEVFSYQIKVVGSKLMVTLIREGKTDIVKEVEMANSGYNDADQYMYFKAGVYNQNKTGEDDDYVQATFYKIENSHDGYKY